MSIPNSQPVIAPLPPKRPASIAKALAVHCPVAMTADELGAAADYNDAHADAFPIVSRLDRFDRETRICRGGKG